MDIDINLDDFTNRCRLFPLPGVVLFPNAILPLHIFEPRYREMSEDALASDRLVTIVQIRPMAQGFSWTEPVPIADVACLGKILKYERLPDGRFNYLLLGCKRVRLGAEIATDKLYRIANADILEDIEADSTHESHRKELVNLFLEAFEQRHRLDFDLAKLVRSSVSLGVLTDIMAHASDLSPMTKQRLLSETNVAQRIEILLEELRILRNDGDSSLAFPPPFSAN